MSNRHRVSAKACSRLAQYRLVQRAVGALASGDTHASNADIRPVFFVGYFGSGKSTIAAHFRRLCSDTVTSFDQEYNHTLWFPDLYPWHRSRVPLPPLWYDPETYLRYVYYAYRQRNLETLRKTVTTLGRLQRRRWVIIDSGRTLWLLPMLIQLWPEASVIHVAHNGPPTIYRYAKRVRREIARYKRYRELGYATIQFDELLRRCAALWNCGLHCSGILEPLPNWFADVFRRTSTPPAALTVRFEDYLESPARVLQQIVAYCDIPLTLSDGTVGPVQLRTKRNPSVPPDVGANLVSLTKTGLTRLGYPTPE